MATIKSWLITQGAPGAGGGGGPTPPPIIPVGINQPNPAETVWTLGTGGVAFRPLVRAGLDLILTTSLFNNGVLLSYTPDPDLEAVVWSGEDQPNGFFPQVEWTSAPASSLRLAIPGVSTAGFEPGVYRMRVGLTTQGVRLLAYDGTLEILASPGSDLRREPYVTNDDLLLYYDQLPALQNDRADQAAYRGQRVDASDKLDRMLINRLMIRPGYTRRRFPDYDPDLGYDRPDPAIAPPTKAQLTSWLAAKGLVVDPVAREIVARMAIALILDRQETDAPNSYRDHSQGMRDRVVELWATYKAQLDADLDGVADWVIDTDATFLPDGAAP